MNCRKCKREMLKGSDGNVLYWCCHFCGVTTAYRAVGGPDVPLETKAASPRLSGAFTGHIQGQSEGEALFEAEWQARFPELKYEREYEFCLHRDWRLDFAFVTARIAVEVESSVHRTKGRFETDLPKYNALSSEGWLLFRGVRKMLESDPERFCRMVSSAIRAREVEV